MFAIATAGGGNSLALPDTCKTPAPPGPPVPIPYPNTAMLTAANRATTSLKVMVLMQPVITMKTIIMSTTGDQAGSVGGVVSGMIAGPAQAKKASMKVMAEASPVVHHTCMFGHNGIAANASSGVHATPSQMKVFVGG